MNHGRSALVLALLAPLAWLGASYPLDGYERTGIRRLEAFRLVQEGDLSGGPKLPPGARLETNEVLLRMFVEGRDFRLTDDTPRDPVLQRGLERILSRYGAYSLALLDITDPAHPRYAAVREHTTFVPGSVGKLLVTAGLLDALARVHPDTAARMRVLRETSVTADGFIVTDSHTVPIVDLEAPSLHRRPIRIGDTFSLWEWVDHMVSPSSNAGGSTVWKETLLLDRFGRDYPVSGDREDAFLDETPKTELQAAAVRVVNDPIRRLGIPEDAWRQGGFFTRGAQQVIPSASNNRASPFALLQFLVALEQGRIVDAWSSLEFKRLLYFTRARYRYASSPALSDAAVYFKSGSLYSCRPEPGYTCRKYQGNRFNYMNSVAIVESPARGPDRRVYLVALMSNVPRRNSAADHRRIAAEIERLIRQES